MLYNEDAVIAITAGMAYCISNAPTGLVPNSNVAALLSMNISLLSLQKYENILIR